MNRIVTRSRWIALVLVVLFGAISLRAGDAWASGSDITLRTTQGDVRVRYFPAPGSARRPAVLLLHGSSPVDHDGSGFQAYTDGLAQRGIDANVVFYYNDSDTRSMTSPDHAVRSSTFEKRLPSWVAEVREVASYALSLPNASGGLALMGFSNGATLAVATAGADTRCAGVVDFYGSYPGGGITIKHLPPLIIFHGDADRVIPVIAANELAQYAKSIGGWVDLHIYPGVGHVFDASNSPATTDAQARAFQFLQSVFR